MVKRIFVFFLVGILAVSMNLSLAFADSLEQSAKEITLADVENELNDYISKKYPDIINWKQRIYFFSYRTTDV